jgi:hypothetical protein
VWFALKDVQLVQVLLYAPAVHNSTICTIRNVKPIVLLVFTDCFNQTALTYATPVIPPV